MGYRQVGKARDSESRIRWFESSYPSHYVFYVIPVLESQYYKSNTKSSDLAYRCFFCIIVLFYADSLK